MTRPRTVNGSEPMSRTTASPAQHTGVRPGGWVMRAATATTTVPGRVSRAPWTSFTASQDVPRSGMIWSCLIQRLARSWASGGPMA